jgi:hypothetical protein
MTRNSTAPVAAPPAIVAEAWQQVGASFDRFCLASGVAALQTMMEQDATHLCGVVNGPRNLPTCGLAKFPTGWLR